MKKQLCFYFLSMFITITWSQQDVQFTEYMYNMSVVNPAYTTDNPGEINTGLLYRMQWVGVEGSPTSASLFAHAPLGDKVEVGFSLLADDIGDIVKEYNLSLDFAYKLTLDYKSKLSFGMKAGANIFNTQFTGLNLESGQYFTDPNFNENINNTFLNIGIGAFYYTDEFYFGVSVPNLLNTQYLSKTKGLYEIAEERHMYVTSGYVFQVNNQFKLKPSVLVKAVAGSPIIVDANMNVLYNDKVEFGLGYRLKDAVSAMINFRVTPEFRIGYAYDYTTTNLNNFSSGSHEIMFLYDINIFFNGFNKSPRFF
ncbi:PorP/SprF family type IX secretion system membrane protein [Polaribacter sp.]|uniref:PorP/SprF family type IX secretion system membrane protein n=1 Tax=Polaribacter sp. TaxID=1920175 RepID=UPI003EF5EBBA